jgi:DNA-3-methyladenine glycosylase I
MLAYHDAEWGVPLHDDRALFELLILEGAQAGLSWTTILNRREGYRNAFVGFDLATVAAFGQDDEARLLADAGIVRNRAKIQSTIGNAQAALRVAAEQGSLDRYLWSFVDGRPIQNEWQNLGELPAETDASRAMSRDLKHRGFSFVGPTICYAFMQSAGLVNDHQIGCFRYAEVAGLA